MALFCADIDASVAALGRIRIPFESATANEEQDSQRKRLNSAHDRTDPLFSRFKTNPREPPAAPSKERTIALRRSARPQAALDPLNMLIPEKFCRNPETASCRNRADTGHATAHFQREPLSSRPWLHLPCRHRPCAAAFWRQLGGILLTA